MIFACVISHKMGNVWYLIVFAIAMTVGMLNYDKKKAQKADRP